MISWAARKPFIDKNRAAMIDFMEDTLRTVRWYLDNSKWVENVTSGAYRSWVDLQYSS